MEQLLKSFEEVGTLNQRQVKLYNLLEPFLQDWKSLGDVRSYVKEKAPELYTDFGREFPFRCYSPTLEGDLDRLKYLGLTESGLSYPKEIRLRKIRLRGLDE